MRVPQKTKAEIPPEPAREETRLPRREPQASIMGPHTPRLQHMTDDSRASQGSSVPLIQEQVKKGWRLHTWGTTLPPRAANLVTGGTQVPPETIMLGGAVRPPSLSSTRETHSINKE